MDFLERFKKDIKEQFQKQYKLFKTDNSKGSEMFLEIIKESRESFYNFSKENNLNGGKFGGHLIEWVFKFALEVVVDVKDKSRKLVILNDRELPFPWKNKKNSKPNVHIDIMIKETKKRPKILSCIELKTNPEDKFDKYYSEQRIINHQRQKNFKDFKYHYVAFNSIPKKFEEKNDHKRKIKTLKNNKLFWVLPIINTSINEETIETCSNMLKSLYSVIENYE